jgi:beta-glucosidase
MDLPYDQTSLLDKLVKVNPLVVLVLNAGSCINLEPLKEKVPAMMMMWYDGEQGGNAVADVLLGRANPAGRLPVTFYKSFQDVPPIDDYELTRGRTYLYLNKPVAFPFGHGISYTSFSYANLKLTPPGNAEAAVGVTVDVTNTGDREGDEVVQMYVHKTQSSIPRPIKQLVGFQRVHFAKGEKRTVTFAIPQHEFAIWDTNSQKFVTESGAYEFMAGASSEDIRQRGTVEIK